MGQYSRLSFQLNTVAVPGWSELAPINPTTGFDLNAPTGQGATSDIKPGEEVRVPVMEEQVTVEKKPVVKEEITVGKRAVQDTERVGGEVRKEDVRVEREGKVDVREGGTGKK